MNRTFIFLLSCLTILSCFASEHERQLEAKEYQAAFFSANIEGGVLSQSQIKIALMEGSPATGSWDTFYPNYDVIIVALQEAKSDMKDAFKGFISTVIMIAERNIRQATRSHSNYGR